ncbi:hypothetical protein QE152_g6514 [Popillia japonica]|uniref:Uncharacterized protein n=1 Tax=Popillia japonica TaxID=7064 RepID=A0AAW1MHP7_POPJA
MCSYGFATRGVHAERELYHCVCYVVYFHIICEQSITGKSGKGLVENRYNNSKVPSKRKKFIFSSDWECQYKKQLLVIKKLNRTVTKLERELAEIKSLLLKVRKDKIQNEVNTKDKKIAEYTSDRKISVTSEVVPNNDLHGKLAKIPLKYGCSYPQNRILLLADSQGRCVSNIMRESMNNYDITCIFKPNANWECVVDSIDCLASQGRCVSNIMRESMNNYDITCIFKPNANWECVVDSFMRESMNNYDITCIFKPNANWECVVDSIDCLAADYGKSDYVIVWAGLNDAFGGRTTSREVFREALAGVSHTNVILVTVPFLHNRPVLNSFIANVILVTVPFLHNRPVLNSFIANINNGLGSVTETCDHVFCVDINRGLLSAADFSGSGPHLKHIGKLKVVSAVSSFIESHLSEYKDHQAEKFINFQNLIFISTVTDNDDEKISLSRVEAPGSTVTDNDDEKISLNRVEAPGNSRSNRLTDVRSTHAKGLDKQVAVERRREN